MTSPKKTTAASAEQSSENRRGQAQSQPEAGTNVPATASTAENTPLSSTSTASQGSLGHASSVSGSLTLPPLSAPASHLDLPSGSTKRTASSSEPRSSKSRRGSPDSHQPLATPTASTGAHFTPTSYPFVPTGTTSRPRIPGYEYLEPTTPAYAREPQGGRRGRSRKVPTDHAEYQPSTGPRVDDQGDIRTSGVSSRLSRADLLDFHAPLSSYSHFGLQYPSETPSAGPSSTFCYRQNAGVSFPGVSHFFPPSPAMSTRESVNTSSWSEPRSGLPRLPPPSSASSIAQTPVSAASSTSPTSSITAYGAPDLQRPWPPSQNMPTMDSALRQASISSSVEADGFMVLRNVIPIGYVREVVSMVGNGLQMSTRSETTQHYGVPVQAYLVRDEFVMNWRQALQPFYEPLGKKIPKMPSQTQLCAFRKTDPDSVNRSLLHVGGKHQLLVHIALTDLSPENGLFNLLRGSHQAKHPSMVPTSDWAPTAISLAEGDALVWRGDMSYIRSTNGGGIYIVLNFDWGPTVDLTGE